MIAGCGGDAALPDAAAGSAGASGAAGASGTTGTGGASAGAGGGATGTAGSAAGTGGGTGGITSGTAGGAGTGALAGTGGGGGGAAGTTGGGASGGTTQTCGFVMPNPVASGLPNPASYDTSVAGIVTDKVTGLSWQRKLTGQAASEGCTVNITGLLYCPLRYAAAYCAASRLGGYADWRVPTFLELLSLIDFTQTYSAIDATAFPDTPYEGFWTSTRTVGLDAAWQLSFATGSMLPTFIDESHHVRCVRTAGAPPPRCAQPGMRFQVSGDVATDALTGLTWQRAAGSSSTTFATATAYCSGLGNSFRLPSIKELFTLGDFFANPSKAAMLDTTVFERPQSYYWSSTPDIDEYMSIWSLNYQNADSTAAIAGSSNTNGAVKCVR